MEAKSESLVVINYSGCSIGIVDILEVSIVVIFVMNIDLFFNNLLHA